MNEQIPSNRRSDGRSLEVIDTGRQPERTFDHLPAGYSEDTPAFMATGGAGFDWMRLLWGVWKHRRLVLATTAAAFVLSIIVTLLMPPIYRSTATLQLDRDSISVVKVEGFEPTQTGEDRGFLQTQYQLLQSRSLAEHVMNKLGLMDDLQFLPRRGGGVFAALRDLIAPPDESTTQDAVGQRRNAVLGLLAADLSVRGVGSSRIVEVSYDHRDRETARRVADAFAKTFITDNLDRKYAASSYARTFLEERLQQLKVRLEENERELRNYAEENKIVRLDNEDSLISAKLSAMNENLSKAKDDRIRLESIWREAEKSPGMNLSKVQENRTIQDIRVRRDELAAQYQEKLGIFKANFPEMQQMKARIDEFDRIIQQQIANIKESIRKDYLSALAREEGVKLDIADLEKNLNDQRNKAIQYNILKREVDSSKTIYDGLLQRYKEIGVAGGVGTNNISLIDPAVLANSPRSPRVMLNLAIGLLGGLLLGVGISLAVENLDTRFKNPEDVELVLGLPVLGIIPKVDGNGYVEARTNSRSAIAEAYRSLRTSIQFSTARGTPKSIYVTSTKQSEGKSTTAVVLSDKFTQLGLRVLLIDADMRKPSLHKKMVLQNEVGLSNYLIGSVDLSDIVQTTDSERLFAVTTGPLPPNPAELLASTRTLELLRQAGEAYDMVVFDGPPLLGLADSVIMSNFVETTILVIAANDCRKNAAIGALRRLQGSRSRIIGAVFTKFDTRQSGYGYGYGYGQDSYYAYGSEHTALPKSEA